MYTFFEFRIYMDIFFYFEQSKNGKLAQLAWINWFVLGKREPAIPHMSTLYYFKNYLDIEKNYVKYLIFCSKA